jgi:hypothetical protein
MLSEYSIPKILIFLFVVALLITGAAFGVKSVVKAFEPRPKVNEENPSIMPQKEEIVVVEEPEEEEIIAEEEPEEKEEIEQAFVVGDEEIEDNCGDGICAEDEECRTCPRDCGECTCTDSDKGHNIVEKGSVSGFFNGEYYNYEDYCSEDEGQILLEFYCGEFFQNEYIVDCAEFGGNCSLGRCINCSACPYCGDGLCNGRENCKNCADDCGNC